MRLHITGNAGAGKTTLARELSEQLNLPLFHLDSVVWKSGWRETPDQEKAARIRELTLGHHWLIEGVSKVVRAEADLVIFLDTSRWLCLYRCVRRCFAFGFSGRPELPANCPEIWILFRAIQLVWRFPALVGETIRGEAQEKGYLVAKSPEHAKILLRQHLQG